MGPARFIKVAFPLPPDEGDTELLWAEALGEHTFRVANVPLHVFGLANEDVISATDEGGRLTFHHVVRRGGHSSYRIALQPNVHDDRARELIARLERMGCGFERSASHRLIGIDLPPSTDIYKVYGVLQEGLDDGTWWFDEMHVGHALRTDG